MKEFIGKTHKENIAHKVTKMELHIFQKTELVGICIKRQLQFKIIMQRSYQLFNTTCYLP